MSQQAKLLNSAHAEHSVLREKIIEHLFVGQVLRALWRSEVRDVEVMRSEFDAHGYDLVITHGGLVRHLQLKTGLQAKPGRIGIARSLASRPSGCAIWLGLNDALEIRGYWWLGADRPGDPLVFGSAVKVAKRIGRQANAHRPDRKNHVVPAAKDWVELKGLAGCINQLLGLSISQ